MICIIKKIIEMSFFPVDQHLPCVQVCIYVFTDYVRRQKYTTSPWFLNINIAGFAVLSLTPGMLILLTLLLITTVVVMLFDGTVMNPNSVASWPHNH